MSFDLGSNRSKSKEITLQQMEQINKLRSVEQNLMKSVYGTLTHNESRFSTSISQQALLENSGKSNKDQKNFEDLASSASSSSLHTDKHS